ncbi:hypothetical protein F8M41_022002 [Gigaspora margarita]|uniref:Uncharacterized protein n=1 Tax=Gigaspora margarita TaxID=4874 RepID=A0A8H4AFR7_GIGMA|nr:hypothetical protein F8M41_022002 [Gigaspora margarita]
MSHYLQTLSTLPMFLTLPIVTLLTLSTSSIFNINKRSNINNICQHFNIITLSILLIYRLIEQEKGSDMMLIIYFGTTKIPFTVSDQFSRTIPDNINLTEPLQNFYQLYSNVSFTKFPKYQLSIKMILNIFRKLEKMFNDDDNEALM